MASPLSWAACSYSWPAERQMGPWPSCGIPLLRVTVGGIDPALFLWACSPASGPSPEPGRPLAGTDLPGSPVATFPVPVGVTATHPGVSTPIRVNRDTRRNTSKPARHLDTKYCSMPRQLSLGLPWHTRVYDWNPWHLDMLGCCEPTRSCLQSVTSSCGKRRILLFVCKLYGLGISI